ncbi:hypothetical protein ACR82Z_02550 [Mycoplasma sp. 6243]|uniref:hypothetical protein n=1 Tax=Mycoplasma sp. 6243 TaxID=3440865 RepID=UPI003EC115B5
MQTNETFLKYIFLKHQSLFNFIFKTFIDLDVIEKYDLSKIQWIEIKNNFNSFNTAVNNFLQGLIVKNTNKLMLKNFFIYMFLQLIYKNKNHKFIKTCPFFDEIQNEITFNNKKRSYYYDFLDEFKKIPNYNIFLIKILRRLL